MTISILARDTDRALPYPHPEYFRDYATLPPEPPIERSMILRLPAVTVATLRYTAPPADDLHPTSRGLATEASILLAAWARRRDLSGWTVAEEFQDRYYGGRNRGFTRGLETYRRVPRKAFDLLAATDQIGLVQWWCDIEDPDDWRRFETVRLTDALARMTSPQRTKAALK